MSLFLSTPSARRATAGCDELSLSSLDFYPRPPRGGRHGTNTGPRCINLFLSTPSARRATQLAISGGGALFISIHALREEGDGRGLRASRWPKNFYPRPPRGGRPSRKRPLHPTVNFYPRPPRGGRPLRPAPQPAYRSHFYPRPPRGGRPPVTAIAAVHRNFYPRPPRGGRRTIQHSVHPLSQISIHALREEGDLSPVSAEILLHNFYPRPPRGGRPGRCPRPRPDRYFYPRPPRGGRPHPLRQGGGCERFLSTPSARRATMTSYVIQ